MRYGLWDTNPEGNPGWLGDSKGPKTFDSFGEAQVGRQAWLEQTGWKPERVHLKKYHPNIGTGRHARVISKRPFSNEDR
jgi:hypothetical protein